jgi:hypothetical protein
MYPLAQIPSLEQAQLLPATFPQALWPLAIPQDELDTFNQTQRSNND